MIQVIDRLFQILEVLSRREKAGLATIAAEVGLAKGTAGNILKTLVDLGYLGKNDLSEYYFAGRFYDLVEANIQRDVLMRLAQHHAAALSGQVRETVVVAALRDHLYYVIAEAVYDQTVTVSANVYQSRPLYRSVTGRVLLAFSEPQTRREVLRRVPLTEGEWAGVMDEASLVSACERLKDEGFAELERDHVYAVANPVFGPDGRIACSIGLYMPVSRRTSENRSAITDGVRHTAERMSRELSLRLQTIGGCYEQE